MIAVIDVSASVELVLNRPRAEATSEWVTEADMVIAPSLYVAEVGNTFWKYQRFARMPMDECEQAIENALAIPDRYHPEIEFHREAFALAIQVEQPVYDMFYLVLARRHDAHLLTLDRSLQQTALAQHIRCPIL